MNYRTYRWIYHLETRTESIILEPSGSISSTQHRPVYVIPTVYSNSIILIGQ